MQSGAFEPDDLFKRGGLFSSLIGFKKKANKAPPSRQSSIDQPLPAGCSTSREEPRVFQPLPQISLQVAEEQTPIVQQQRPNERTPFDIYREIVSEVEHFERSSTATPISEFSIHSPSSLSPQLPPHLPQMDPMMGYHQPLQQEQQFFPTWSNLLPPNHPNLDYQSMTMQKYQQCPFMQQVSSLDAPPAYPGMVPQFSQMSPETSKMSIIPPSPFPYFPPPLQQYPLLDVKDEPLEAKLLNALQTQAPIEEFVKLIVRAVKNEEAQPLDESPEVILQRKRQQNNAAAARYRKRQREAKQNAGDELQDLLDRNQELKGTVDRMQLEIELLKRAVLSATRKKEQTGDKEENDERKEYDQLDERRKQNKAASARYRRRKAESSKEARNKLKRLMTEKQKLKENVDLLHSEIGILRQNLKEI
ncbi:unnamed protein product, partial [Mesorhabditis belari]|uniref:BZIP domain-containing protein n=1 Tax=Mesorhabditis belari TaxID=2138241 RepID=A0AAF3ELY6_9BILA